MSLVEQVRAARWICVGIICCWSTRSAVAGDAIGTNPFQKGCLYASGISSKIRVCSSDDPPEVVGVYCRAPLVQYDEIRIQPGNWESPMLTTWIVQVLLSEMLDVPTSIEMRAANIPPLSMYQPNNSMQFPPGAFDYKTFEKAHELKGDCSKADRSQDNYQECASFYPESWDTQDMESTNQAIYDDHIEPPQSLGMIGQNAWFVPKFTASRDSTVLDYRGLQGPEKRQKLAEHFHRPTTWKDYCDQVSSDGCSSPDNVAARPPQNQDEEQHFFHSGGIYTGHFRPTDKNNCTLHPDSCTGFFADYPCEWGSPVATQLYNLDIALDVDLDVHPGGLTHGQLTQIWRAANATKSDMIGYWWHPDVFPSEFLASPAEFTHVSLPPPSVACMSAREGVNLLHCDADVEKRIGSALTVCDDPPMLLSKLLSTTIFDSIKDPTLPQGIVSPSHSVLANYRLSSIQLDEIFFIWNRRGDAREAVCEWIVDNMDHLEELVPRTYPRAFQKKDHAPLMYASTLLGAIVVVLVLVTLFLVHRNQNRRSVKYSQIEFLVLLLVGSLFIGMGAIVIGIPSTNASCIAEVWLINIGYTLELVPLIVKVAAVNHIMSVGKKMRRSRLDRRYLFGVVATICTLLVIFLILWSVLDTPKVMQEYELTETKNEDGETIVWVLDVCGSESNAWVIISVGWNALLLLCTTTLAVQMRKVGMEGFRETGTLALLVYSHSVFVSLRLFTYLLSSVMKEYFCPTAAAFCSVWTPFPPLSSILSLSCLARIFNAGGQQLALLPYNGLPISVDAPPWIQNNRDHLMAARVE
ncbi:Gamma-aminobutyric acid (GABA) B receptor [Seminavis robusta]|uniref:Gamma-aminobutyric acid (GABA) B receptor n=2 Tax=Seminavis robusta TaxID=568900 RepID=A0A9N8ES82_9STRA|nr:Gamma-aminobutyric acid (GABA) B receptor [Seminavis robusta]|eukprot:Sro1632_g287290.1 Gamma-aminobutyric acid (GABA) B receptor (807) ;mRNA; f:14904-17399